MKEEDSKEDLTKIISNNQNEEDTEVSVKVSVWFHELRDFTEDIIIDENVIPTGVQAGQVFELQSLDEGSSKNLYLLFKRNLRSATNDADYTEALKPKLQISLMANPFQRLLDLAPRSQVQLKRLVKLESVTVDSVEIFIKDVNLSRDAMWNFSASMIGNCVYIDQRLLYLGSRVGVTKHIYKMGKMSPRDMLIKHQNHLSI